MNARKPIAAFIALTAIGAARHRPGRRRSRTRLRVRVTVRERGRRRAVQRALVRVAGRRVRTDRRGGASLRVRFARPGRRALRVTARDLLSRTVVLQVR